MRLWIAIALLASSANAGTITGRVHAEGKKLPDDSGGGGKYDSRKFKFAERVDYSRLRDFVVYIDGPIGDKPTPPATPLQIIVQKDAQFDPHILPVVVGTKVNWPNNDEIYHNAFSMSDAKQFDLGLYKDTAKEVHFDKPGRVDVFCSIHSAMHCVVLVLENPYHTLADARGHYTITNVPPGRYQLKAWHERLPAQTREIQVPADGEVKQDFTLGVSGLPEY